MKHSTRPCLRRTASAVSLIAAVAVLPGSTPAQQYPSQQRGLSADTAYQAGAIDHVNLFNGNLTIRIPLGSSYPVGPGLSFGLTLTYNSNGWDYEDEQCYADPPGINTDYTIPVQDPHTNAGFGWRIQPGRLMDGVQAIFDPAYLSPDGGQHGLYTQLHPGYPEAGTQPDTWFTNDSTYLRMRFFPGATMECTAATGAASTDCYRIEFPDGEIHEFYDFSTIPDEPDWRVTRIRDVFAHDHCVEIDYSTADQWTITDSHDRTQTIHFTGGVVSSVELTAFGDESATYTLVHTPTEIERQKYGPPDCVDGSDPPALITVPLLTRLILPDDSYYEMDYNTNDSSPGVLSGGIKKLRLPTGGELHWDYQQLDFLSQAPDLNFDARVNTAYAVETKEIFVDSETQVGEWSYDYVTHSGSGGNPSAPDDPSIVPCFHTVTVTDPLGHATVNYFDSAARSRWQYGLPMRRCDDAGALLDDPPYPSQEIYDGGPDGELLRSVYVDYGSDGRDSGQHQEKNHRLKQRKVVYHDDSDVFKKVTYSNFDGLGHFRETVASGNFAGDQERTVTTSYNAGNLTLLIDPEDSSLLPGNDFVMPELSDPWVLGTFTTRQVEENGEASVTELCFDTATGFLERTRTLAGTAELAIDVVKVFVEEEIDTSGTGRVATELSYGGDSPAGLSTGDLCTLGLPDPEEAQNRIEHTYAHGALESSTYVNPCDDQEVVLKIADHVIDAATGLVATSRDSADVATAFVYDTMGRLTGTRPAAGAWTETVYQLPAVSQPSLTPQLTVRQCANGDLDCSGSPLSWQRSTYDGLGRTILEERQYPGTGGVTTASRAMGYNVLGWKTSTELWNSSEATTIAHDRFGRVTTITPPDTSLAPTLFRYKGERRIDRSDKVATEAGTEHYVCTREEYDAFGRLVRVNEDRPSSGTGACSDETATGLLTDYAYDEADRLIHVCAGPSGETCAQNRHFTYDGRGFLTAEQHPEIGPSGGGVANYTYDPSGNVLTKDIAGTTDFALRYAYDPANRLITVDEVDGSGSTRPIKSFHYARGNDGTDLRAGKLVLSKRTNWVDIVGPLATEVSGTLPVVISQAYRYEGLDGRVSQHQTRYQFSGGNYAFETGFTYDEQGNVSQLEYPRCLHYPCAGLDPPRTVDFGHTRGFLSSVEDFATSLTYQQGGMLHEVSHANGVVETVAVDAAHPFERPYRITTTSGWDSEVYQYDGSGNVKQIGEQLYLYDRMSRLVNGQVEVGGETKSQTVSYDNYGNILALTTDGSTLATPVTTATNRLSGATYDAGGNLTDVTLSGEHYVYTYDPLNMMKHLQSTTDQARVFLYDADDERVMTFDCAFVQCATQTGRLTTTIRGLDGKVLRVYNFNFGQPWDWVRDYVYRDGLLLASVEPDGGGGETTSHFHLDHLGSPRQITDGSAVETAFHTYYPFGGEATDPGQDEVQLKFTGHERDENGTSDAGKVDYMHARYCSVDLGRFLSPDPANAADRRSPQTWNRFGYASRNPLKRIDPDGLVDEAVWVVQAADPIPVAQAAAAASLARELKIEAGLAVLGGTPNTVRKLSRVLKGLRASRQIKPNRVRYLVGRHADMPSPRPSGFQSHHGVNSVWMEANYSRYRPSEAPAILMPNVPDHNATRGVFNRWRAEIARRQGRRIRDVDWTQVSPGEAWNLAEEQLRSTHVPDDVIEEYYRQFTIYLEHLGGLQ